MRNKLGIIQLELPEITLDGEFNDGQATEITSLLNEEQKQIIKTLGGSKLILLHCKNIIDSVSESTDIIDVILNKGKNVLYASNLYVKTTSAQDLIIRIYESSGKYYIYS